MLAKPAQIENLDLRERKEELKLFVYAVIVGILAGVFASLYRIIIKYIEEFLLKVAAIVKAEPLWLIAWLGLAVLLALGVAFFKRYAPFCGGSGIPQVEAEIKGYIDPKPERILIAKIIGGSLAALAGLALGREGPSIQIGAMTGKLFAKLSKRNKTVERYLLTCGAGAGLAAAFNAPIAGVLFAIEEVHRHVNRKLLVTVMTAALCADVISKLWFGVNTVFHFDLATRIPLSDYWLILVFGVILAFLGILYVQLMQFMIKLNRKLPLPASVKLIPYFCLPALLLYFAPQLLGGGHFMFAELMQSDLTVKVLLALFIVKLIFAITSFSCGVPGGIFFPILVLGASLGAMFATVFAPANYASFIILGMAGYLTAIVRAPLTAIVLIFEMTGNITYLLPLSLVCLTTYLITNYFNCPPIYEYLLEKLMQENKLAASESQERVQFQFVVEAAAPIVNQAVRALVLPKNCLLVSIEREGKELIPRGDTIILNGDTLSIVAAAKDLYNYYEDLATMCAGEKLSSKDPLQSAKAPLTSQNSSAKVEATLASESSFTNSD